MAWGRTARDPPTPRRRVAHNLELLRALPQIAAAGYPVLAGLSRKSSLGTITGRPVLERMPATLRRSMRGGATAPVPLGQDPAVLSAYMQKLVAVTRRLHDAGITLVAGTDQGEVLR